MSLIELILIAVGLSMDAFAVSICKGLALPESRIKEALIVGLYFGAFQAVMPLIGYFAGLQFAGFIVDYDHWIAFVLLAFIGGKMVYESREEACVTENGEQTRAAQSGEQACAAQSSQITCAAQSIAQAGAAQNGAISPAKMLPLAVATSIDALAVGVSLAFLPETIGIGPSVAIIGCTTLTISMLGVKVGKLVGARLKRGAELAGGIVLVAIGLKILIEHLFFQ